MKRPLIGILVTISSLSSPVMGYEWATHALMGTEALKKTAFGLPDSTSYLPYDPQHITRQLGFTLGPNASLSSRYFDLNAGIASVRFATTFESDIFKKLDEGKTTIGLLSRREILDGWLARGLIREDDVVYDPDNSLDNTPQDEPGGNFQRVFGHFYDPRNDSALTQAFRTLGPKAPDWAVDPGALVPFTPIVSPKAGNNHFGVTQAREAMWRALTLTVKQPDGSLLPIDPATQYQAISDAGTTWSSSTVTLSAYDIRQAYWATVFRAVGDIVHLIQDMAQPQHTRNDPHSGKGCVSLPYTDGCAGGHDSFYENYIDARATSAQAFKVREGFFTKKDVFNAEKIPTPGLTLDTPSPYPKPQFNSYREYFSSGTGNAVDTGTGLADYSNRGFYSFGTNIASPAALSWFPSPSPIVNGPGLTSVVMPTGTVLAIDGVTPLPGSVTFYTGPVHDSLLNTDDPNIKLSTHGAFNQFLQASSGGQFSLNYLNYDDQQRLLIPRAIAYGAGLIDYFFRGRLDIVMPSDGVYAAVDHAVANRGKFTTAAPGSVYDGFTKIKAKVKNMTPPVTQVGSTTGVAQEMLNGTVVAVVKYHLNDCYRSDLSGELLQTAQNTLVYPTGCDPSGSTVPSFTTPIEEIVTSQPGVDANGATVTSLSLTDYTEMSFAFNPPIPINATDVYLQIAYRGALGNENDAVAVGTRNISEPSYFTFANATDYLFCVNAMFYRNNPDGSLSAAAQNAILAAGGTQQTLTDPVNQKHAHARVILIAQPPYVTPFTSYNPVTVDPSVKVLADKVFLDFGENLRLAYLTDRASGTSVTNSNLFEIGVADTVTADYSMAWDTLIDYNGHIVHQSDDLDRFVTAFIPLRDFRTRDIEFTAKGFGATCDRSQAALLTIDNSNPTASTLVQFTAINF